ncbi:sulfate adenylyltransferase [Lachnospiraceae bacterium MD308]|nr:sulfate adenylyltransferase [Lachnospiraceae bacterium MD308]
MKYQTKIDEETLQDLINIETGLFFPLNGFMGKEEVLSVIESGILPDGKVFPIPITLDVEEDLFKRAPDGAKILLMYQGQAVAEVIIKSRFLMTDTFIEKIFKTVEMAHPGVRKEKERRPWRIGGKTKLLDVALLAEALKPETTKDIFRKKGWSTIVGFQTRNPVHRAHEYIQRLGLEVCDGLFINPVTGWKKRGDFTQEAVVTAYETMFRKFYPENRVYFAGLKTQMRYAGPREAVFHAIIRRNLGCTHFIIGRDHAGVGGYYGAYEAHDYAKKIGKEHNLGIELLLTREPYYCTKCKQIVTDRTCAHYETNRVEISGTIIRKYISDKAIPDETMLRKEIFDAILSCDHVFME